MVFPSMTSSVPVSEIQIKGILSVRIDEFSLLKSRADKNSPEGPLNFMVEK